MLIEEDAPRASIINAIRPRAALFDSGGDQITDWYAVRPRGGATLVVPPGHRLVRYGLIGEHATAVDYLSEELPPVRPGAVVKVRLDKLR
jgi:hypothetical protein